MAQIGRRYLVHVRIGAGKPALGRIKQAASGVQEVLERIAIDNGNCQLAYTSHDGASFGFLVKTNCYAATIRAQLESPGKAFHDPFDTNPEKRISPPLLGDDSILVVEVGEDYNGYGFSKAWTWLQHH